MRNRFIDPCPELNSTMQVCFSRYTHLTQVQRDVYFIVPQSPGERWALPPALRAVDGVAHRMGFPWVIGIAVVTVLALKQSFFFLLLLYPNLKGPAEAAQQC